MKGCHILILSTDFMWQYHIYRQSILHKQVWYAIGKILKEGEPAVEDYINKFLSGGSSDYPIELLKKAGVDMSKKEPVNDALALFGKLLDEMEELLG